MSHFPKLLSSQVAFDVAHTMLDGFDKYCHLFREVNVQAETAFGTGDWTGLQQLQHDRIAYYDKRVRETSVILGDEYDAGNIDDGIWRQIRLHFIDLLASRHQPECAEAFFNSVYAHILCRSCFSGDFIFVRPTISTEYIENEESPTKPTYRAYYPGTRDGLGACFERIVHSFQLNAPFEDLERNIGYVMRVVDEHFDDFHIAPSFRIHVLPSLFFRNKTVYTIGCMINSDKTLPLAVPILHNAVGQLSLGTVPLRQKQLLILFSFTHPYFVVDMEIPSTYVAFPRDLMPRKPRTEIYASPGLQKQGENLFYCDFLYHPQHSSDKFIIVPGIKGLVMLVFTLPSYPYVFEVIEGYFPSSKETTRELVKSKYQLVKRHDRMERVTGTLEYSDATFSPSRFNDGLIEELEKHAPSVVKYQRSKDGSEEIVIRRVYIEHHMTLLNIWLYEGANTQAEHGIIEYGNAIKELIAASIFPGDMLYKNSDATRHDHVVFYDYDGIEYFTDCNVRTMPEPRTEEREMSGEIWYNVGSHDVFPETYRTFLLGDPRVREAFLKHHADFFEAFMWQGYKERPLSEQMHDFHTYNAAERFVNRCDASTPDNAAQDDATPQRAAA